MVSTLGLQIPSKNVLWGVFRGLNTFLEGIWSPMASVWEAKWDVEKWPNHYLDQSGAPLLENPMGFLQKECYSVPLSEIILLASLGTNGD